jgi:predicted dehydrogenase
VSVMTRPVRVALVGAGGRGRIHARNVARSGGTVVAVAEPRPERRERLADEFALPADARFPGWRELAEKAAGLADVVVIATQDHDHADPCVVFAGLGLHLVCEKPIAPDEPAARRVVDAVTRAGVLFTVCHPLRYAPYTTALVDGLRAGRIGELVSVQHLEPVGAWHFAHSYVRGAWRREELASSLLMAKCSHDIDLLTHLVGALPARVASFGNLSHFRADKQPEGASDRCLDCAVEPVCPYSAPRLYRSCLGDPDWEHQLLGAVTETPTEAALDEALRTGPYGRCVYRCDNDVVDHQVVAFEFDSGITATHTVTAFSELAPRQTRVFGTHGAIEGDGRTLRFHDFRGHPDSAVDTLTPGDGRPLHEEGDERLMRTFLTAVADGDATPIVTGIEESMTNHRIVWAAEQARRSGTTVDLAWDTASAGEPGR